MSRNALLPESLEKRETGFDVKELGMLQMVVLHIPCIKRQFLASLLLYASSFYHPKHEAFDICLLSSLKKGMVPDI